MDAAPCVPDVPDVPGVPFVVFVGDVEVERDVELHVVDVLTAPGEGQTVAIAVGRAEVPVAEGDGVAPGVEPGDGGCVGPGVGDGAVVEVGVGAVVGVGEGVAVGGIAQLHCASAVGDCRTAPFTLIIAVNVMDVATLGQARFVMDTVAGKSLPKRTPPPEIPASAFQVTVAVAGNTGVIVSVTKHE